LPEREKRYYAGVDLGGSLTKICLSDRGGGLISRDSIKTEREKGPDYLVQGMSRVVDELIEREGISRSSLAGIGVGAPGPIDIKNGTIIDTPNLAWKDIPLRNMVAETLRLKTALDNDANAAALGEWWKGAGVGSSSLVCFTLGTGVGGGIVIDGDIWHGISDAAGEIGHMTIEIDGRRCNCGNHGCLEAYPSATAISSRTREGIEKGRQSSLEEAVGGDLGKITSEKVYRHAVGGDPFCQEIMSETAEYLSIGVANILNIFNPELIVIGGGVMGAGDLLFVPLIEGIKERAFPIAMKGVRVIPAGLGSDAGMVGAVGVIKKKVEGSVVP